ncbi:CPBP family intramembrane glutamic endopeptidase [Allomuricauda sp. R78024]|uniref:CPBP family intramembrane glutamic endopeptidase n=1 Tax=Allomuricauda sp. R78024 TaxID=3093867 RepID=UPI0037CA494D
MLKKILFNQRGELRVLAKLVSFVLLFQIIGFTALKIGVPFFKDSAFHLSFMVNVVSAFAVVLALYIYSKYLDKSSLAKYGLHLGLKIWKNFILGIIISFGIIILVLIIQGSNIVLDFSPGTAFPTHKPWLVFLSQFLRYFTGSLFEELLATSFLFILTFYSFKPSNRLYPYRYFFSICISALPFGLIHGANENATFLGVFNLILFGAITTSNFAYTRNLGYAIAFHCMWNFGQNIIFGLPNSGKESQAWLIKTTVKSSDLISGGIFGLEGSIITTVFFLLVLTSNIRILKKRLSKKHS